MHLLALARGRVRRNVYDRETHPSTYRTDLHANDGLRARTRFRSQRIGTKKDRRASVAAPVSASTMAGKPGRDRRLWHTPQQESATRNARGRRKTRKRPRLVKSAAETRRIGLRPSRAKIRTSLESFQALSPFKNRGDQGSGEGSPRHLHHAPHALNPQPRSLRSVMSRFRV